MSPPPIPTPAKFASIDRRLGAIVRDIDLMTQGNVRSTDQLKLASLRHMRHALISERRSIARFLPDPKD